MRGGGRFIARLVAHDALRGQGDGTRGIGFLMFVLCLGLHQGGLGHCAVGLRRWLPGCEVPPPVWRSVSLALLQFEVLADRGRLGSLRAAARSSL